MTSPQLDDDNTARALHDEAMASGCSRCGRGSKRPGLVCPDCYLCLYCGTGCSHCAPLRRNYHTPSHKPKKPRGGI